MNPLQPIYTAILAHPIRYFLIYYAFSNVVLTMPPPDAKSGKVYEWVFGFLHAVSGAIPRVASNFLPPGSWIYKLLAGGNGLLNGNGKVDSAPPKA